MSDRILLVEDDRKLAPLVRRYLADHDFEVVWAANGNKAWREFERFEPDVVVLDLMLPGKDGWTLCEDIRAAGKAGILILTARGDERDRVVGLELGADDYLTKPFGLPELLARVRAILRRYRMSEVDPETDVRRVGPFQVDLETRQARRDGESLVLTRTEFDLLELLTRRPGRVYSREQLLDAVRGGETDAFDRAVDRHISNLRAKLERDARSPEFIQTVWGVGYRWGTS